MKMSFSGIRPSYVIKALTYALYTIVLISVLSALLPSAGYRWALPDLILCAVIAVAYYEGEKIAAVFGMLSGFALEGVGGVGVSLLPLFYMLVGCVCALLFLRILGKNLGAYMLYVIFFALIRASISIIYIQLSMPDFSLDVAFVHVLFPEYVATVITAPALFFITGAIAGRLNRKGEIQEGKL